MNKSLRLFVLCAVGGIVLSATLASAATTISTNIQTGGTLSVTGTSILTGNVGIATTTPWAQLSVTGPDTSGSTPAFLAADANNNPLFDVMDNGNVGVGTASPAARLDIQSASNSLLNLLSSASYVHFQMTSYRNSPATHDLIEALAARGTQASPSAVQAGDALLSIRATGYGSTGFENSNDDQAAIDLDADGAFTDAAQSGKIVFWTMPSGSTFDVARMVINSLGQVGMGLGATPILTASLQVATTTTNATTTVELGKTGQNKGTCLVMYDVTGTVQYVTIQGGALVVSSVSCK
jgi:hypothetical protein